MLQISRPCAHGTLCRTWATKPRIFHRPLCTHDRTGRSYRLWRELAGVGCYPLRYARQGKAKQVDHVGHVQLKFVVQVSGTVGFLENSFLIANVASFLACVLGIAGGCRHAGVENSSDLGGMLLARDLVAS